MNHFMRQPTACLEEFERSGGGVEIRRPPEAGPVGSLTRAEHAAPDALDEISGAAGGEEGEADYRGHVSVRDRPAPGGGDTHRVSVSLAVDEVGEWLPERRPGTRAHCTEKAHTPCGAVGIGGGVTVIAPRISNLHFSKGANGVVNPRPMSRP